jgi:hypothetical protein
MAVRYDRLRRNLSSRPAQLISTVAGNGVRLVTFNNPPLAVAISA